MPPPYGPKADFTVNPETANVGQLVTLDPSISTPGCNGTNQMPITKYSWDFGDGNKTDTTTPIIYHAFSSSGIYYPTLTVYASGATPETDAITHRVVVMSVPVGGYSISLTQHNTSMPSSVYLALLIMLSAVFTTVRRKTRREKTTSM
jgi:PKD repeat protein